MPVLEERSDAACRVVINVKSHFYQLTRLGYCVLGRGGPRVARPPASVRPGGISGVCSDVACRVAILSVPHRSYGLCRGLGLRIACPSDSQKKTADRPKSADRLAMKTKRFLTYFPSITFTQRSATRQEYPHSLSYQASTLIRLPITLVLRASNMALCGSWITSADTIGSSV